MGLYRMAPGVEMLQLPKDNSVVGRMHVGSLNPRDHRNTPARTSAFRYTEAEEGREGPGKYTDTEQSLELLVGT